MHFASLEQDPTMRLALLRSGAKAIVNVALIATGALLISPPAVAQGVKVRPR